MQTLDVGLGVAILVPFAFIALTIAYRILFKSWPWAQNH